MKNVKEDYWFVVVSGAAWPANWKGLLFTIFGFSIMGGLAYEMNNRIHANMKESSYVWGAFLSLVF